jgi:hypothetical protein
MAEQDTGKNKRLNFAVMLIVLLAFAAIVSAATKQDVTDLINSANTIIQRGNDALAGKVSTGTSWTTVGGSGLLIVVLAILGFFLWRRFKERKSGASGKSIEHRLIEIIKASIAKLEAISTQFNNMNRDFSPREKALWAAAVSTEGMEFMFSYSKIEKTISERVRKNLESKDDSGNYEFVPVLASKEREQLIKDLTIIVANLFTARKILNNIIDKYFLDRMLRIERLEKKNEEVLVSPVVWADNRVLFVFDSMAPPARRKPVNKDSDPVMLKYAFGASSSFHELPMKLRDGKHIWEATTPALDPGRYKYYFLVRRNVSVKEKKEGKAPTAEAESDPHNKHRQVHGEKMNWFEVSGDKEKAVRETLNTPAKPGLIRENLPEPDIIRNGKVIQGV